MSTHQALSFDHVLNAEREAIAKARETPPDVAPAERLELSALAFSGGGIRSAVFNLGFIQGLANRRALHLFDYLSTVSGGGYIGGWLSAYLHRASRGGVGEAEVRRLQTGLGTPPDRDATHGNSGFPPSEPPAIRFIRRYANYLTPRMGLSGDTLALISIVVRNLVVMQFLLVSLLVALFSLLLALYGFVFHLPPEPVGAIPGRLVSAFALAGVDLFAPGRWLMPSALGLALLGLGLSLWSQSRRRETATERRLPNVWVLTALALALSSGIAFAFALRLAVQFQNPMEGGVWIGVAALVYGLAWSGSLRRSGNQWPRALAGLTAGAAAFALILYLCLSWLSPQLEAIPTAHLLAAAPVTAVALYSLILTLHLAVAGAALSEEQREWWARAGGQGLALGAAWTLAIGVILFLPPLIQTGAEWSLAAGCLWGVLTAAGSYIAQGIGTNGKSSNRTREVVARLTPWFFLGGFLGLVAWGFAALLPGVTLAPATPAKELDLFSHIPAYHEALTRLGPGFALTFLTATGALFIAFIASIDLNLFSAHSLYTNRLARTFLGASRPRRRPNPYSGFDPDDDLPLANLSAQRPLHLINTAINLSGGQELAWQTRRAASFVFTPLHCGYNTQDSLGRRLGGYRQTTRYADGLTLATAVATSGAAASPNMGFHSSPSVAALLTTFNLRLARWCPNPTASQWTRREPRFWSAGPLFAELSGEADSRGAWINLSDGGHFDNLGIYELVRRRAHLILATDVGADDAYHFDDLAMAVRKVWVDFGVHIELRPADLDAIRPTPTTGASARSWAIGRIHYPGGGPHGYLIYVKSSMPRLAPIDIRQYRDAHPDFPHQPTADQWFNEDQFEAYRHLGQMIAEALCDELLPGKPGTATEMIAGMAERLRGFWDGPAVPQE